MGCLCTSITKRLPPFPKEDSLPFPSLPQGGRVGFNNWERSDPQAIRSGSLRGLPFGDSIHFTTARA